MTRSSASRRPTLQLVAKEILRVSEMVKVVVADTITIVKTEDMNELEPLQEKGEYRSRN